MLKIIFLKMNNLNISLTKLFHHQRQPIQTIENLNCLAKYYEVELIYPLREL